MKPALLIIPKVIDEAINNHAYLSACINKVIADDCVPLTPYSYEYYKRITTMEYINQVEPVIAVIYLFVDFGTDSFMNNISTRYSVPDSKIEIRIYRFTNEESKKFKTGILHILRQVSDLSGISLEALKAKNRMREIVKHRQYYFKRAKDNTKCSLAQIGQLVGKDHATVLHGIKMVNETVGMLEDYEIFFGDKPLNQKKEITKYTSETLLKLRRNSMVIPIEAPKPENISQPLIRKFNGDEISYWR